MAFQITQTPAVVNLAQSPIIFTVYEDSNVITSSSFQYVADLYYWTGSLGNSGSSADYTLVKYPNSSDRGIFDLNRIIYSTLQDLREANSSNVKFFAADCYWQYKSGSAYITGSHIKSSTYVALDGYGIFGEPIGATIQSKTPYWPLMLDGPPVQSVLSENTGTIGLWRGQGLLSYPYDHLIISSSAGNEVVDLASILPPSISSNTTSSVYQLPAFPASSGSYAFMTGSSWYSLQLGREEEGIIVGTTPPLRFNVECGQKYPNIRIKWKNRYGQFDYLNFNLVSRQTFQTTKRTYQPQIGSWNGTSLTYQNYETSKQNYISDSAQLIEVNTNWLSEEHNEILKQLMVSDEIYWIIDEPQTTVRPLTMESTEIVFKTGVVDKLIQYTMTFAYGQSYKLIL